MSRLLSLLLVIATIIWSVTSYRGPPVQSDSVPPTTISAVRGRDALEFLLGDESPHPAGSPENAAVRRRLVELLEGIGLRVTLLPFSVNGVTMCNVLARLPGDRSRRPLLLATHYDSVPSGPGAADAAACVAALLETARALNAERRLRPGCRLARDVFLLFSDGEEFVPGIGRGLNGARHFVSGQTPANRLVVKDPIVLNFDARGSSGPSLMFETSEQNYALMRCLLPALSQPVCAASSYVTVYGWLPNATDFTVFKQHGWEGLNFAFIRRADTYHTAKDTLANLDLRSVQHHGENALGVTRRLLNLDQDNFSADEDAVFFALFDRWLICYPESLAVPLAILLLGMQLAGTWRSLRGGATGTGAGVTAVAVTLALLLSLAGGLVCQALVTTRVLDRSGHGFSHADPWLMAALWLWALAASFGALRVLVRLFHVSTESVWTSVWLGWASAGLAVALAAPGCSYVLLAVGLAPALLSLLPYDKFRLSVVAVGAAAAILVPLGYALGIALGPRMAPTLSCLFVLFWTPLLPQFASRPPAADRG